MRLFWLALLVPGCTWPEHSFRDATDAAVEDAGFDATIDAALDATVGPDGDTGEPLPMPTSCGATSTKATACDVLALFTGSRMLDGAGDEFCRVDAGVPENPPRLLTIADADRTEPAPPPASIHARAEIRAGLSSFGVHVFVQVQGDERILVDKDDYTRADAVEIYLRGNKELPLNGDLESDFAQVIVIAPPTETTSARANLYLRTKKDKSIDPSYFAARRVQGGWEAELHYPWTELMNEAAPGQVIGFDVALDVKDDPAAKTREVRMILHEETLADSPPCKTFGIAHPDPLCDDRTWCLAKAYVR